MKRALADDYALYPTPYRPRPPSATSRRRARGRTAGAVPATATVSLRLLVGNDEDPRRRRIPRRRHHVPENENPPPIRRRRRTVSRPGIEPPATPRTRTPTPDASPSPPPPRTPPPRRRGERWRRAPRLVRPRSSENTRRPSRPGGVRFHAPRALGDERRVDLRARHRAVRTSENVGNSGNSGPRRAARATLRLQDAEDALREERGAARRYRRRASPLRRFFLVAAENIIGAPPRHRLQRLRDVEGNRVGERRAALRERARDFERRNKNRRRFDAFRRDRARVEGGSSRAGGGLRLRRRVRKKGRRRSSDAEPVVAKRVRRERLRVRHPPVRPRDPPRGHRGEKTRRPRSEGIEGRSPRVARGVIARLLRTTTVERVPDAKTRRAYDFARDAGVREPRDDRRVGVRERGFRARATRDRRRDERASVGNTALGGVIGNTALGRARVVRPSAVRLFFGPAADDAVDRRVHRRRAPSDGVRRGAIHRRVHGGEGTAPPFRRDPSVRAPAVPG